VKIRVTAQNFEFDRSFALSQGLLSLKQLRRAFGGDGGTMNAGGDAPPDPPSVGDVTGPFPTFFIFFKK
jgi:hypothetical protein